MIRRAASIVAALALVAVCSLCARASAAIYWGNSGAIGRADNDGSFRQNIGGPIGGVCGMAVDASHIYWGDRERETIGRANLDGSEVNLAFVGGASEPCGVAVDGTYVYWGNQGSSSIGRARLDGTEVNQEFIKIPNPLESTVGPRPCGLAVNGTHIFWGNYWEDLVGRARLDGGEVVPNFIEANSACGVAVDGTHIFWGGYSDGIGRANIDGSSPEPKFITGLEKPCAVAVDGARLYWAEEGAFPGRPIGSANLDGTLVDRNLVTDIRPSCGIAVNSLSFTPPPPPPQLLPPSPPSSLCELQTVRRLPRQGNVLIAVLGPSATEIEVLTRGLRSRVVSKKAPPTANTNPRRWWVAVWAGNKGRAAKRIRQRLDKDGRVTVDLGVRCTGGRGELPTTATRSLTLVAAKPDREKPAAK